MTYVIESPGVVNEHCPHQGITVYRLMPVMENVDQFVRGGSAAREVHHIDGCLSYPRDCQGSTAPQRTTTPWRLQESTKWAAGLLKY